MCSFTDLISAAIGALGKYEGIGRVYVLLNRVQIHKPRLLRRHVLDAASAAIKHRLTKKFLIVKFKTESLSKQKPVRPFNDSWKFFTVTLGKMRGNP